MIERSGNNNNARQSESEKTRAFISQNGMTKNQNNTSGRLHHEVSTTISVHLAWPIQNVLTHGNGNIPLADVEYCLNQNVDSLFGVSFTFFRCVTPDKNRQNPASERQWMCLGRGHSKTPGSQLPSSSINGKQHGGEKKDLEVSHRNNWFATLMHICHTVDR